MDNYKERCVGYAKVTIKNILEAMQVELVVEPRHDENDHVIIIKHKKDSLIQEEL